MSSAHDACLTENDVGRSTNNDAGTELGDLQHSADCHEHGQQAAQEIDVNAYPALFTSINGRSHCRHQPCPGPPPQQQHAHLHQGVCMNCTDHDVFIESGKAPSPSSVMWTAGSVLLTMGTRSCSSPPPPGADPRVTTFSSKPSSKLRAFRRSGSVTVRYTSTPGSIVSLVIPRRVIDRGCMERQGGDSRLLLQISVMLGIHL